MISFWFNTSIIWRTFLPSHDSIIGAITTEEQYSSKVWSLQHSLFQKSATSWIYQNTQEMHFWLQSTKQLVFIPKGYLYQEACGGTLCLARSPNSAYNCRIVGSKCAEHTGTLYFFMQWWFIVCTIKEQL